MHSRRYTAILMKDAKHPYVQENHLTGSADTGGWKIHYLGQGLFSVGVILNLLLANVLVMQSTGLSGMRRSLPGTGTWKDSRAYAEVITDGSYAGWRLSSPFEMSCVETAIQQKIKENYSDRFMVHSRWAHLTKPNQIHLDQGRGDNVRLAIFARVVVRLADISVLFLLIALGEKNGQSHHTSLLCSSFHCL